MNKIFIADRLQGIKPSATLALSAKANQMKSEGIDVINLGAGEPDFNTPDWVKIAAKAAIDNNFTRYTAVDGIATLKKAIIKKLAKDNNLSYQEPEIIVSNGGKQVIFNAMMATINDGDEVIVPAPYWVSYPDIVNLFKGKPVFVKGLEKNDFKITPEILAQAITPKTKWLILNSPSNPGGTVYTKEELKLLGEVLLQNPHVLILSDDIYEYLIFDGQSFSNIVMEQPNLQERTLIVNGVSKSYSMTGWRIGYGAGPGWLIKNMTAIQSQSTSNPCSIAQMAALAALDGDLDFMNEWKNSFKTRRDLFLDGLKNIKGLDFINPVGAFYIYIGCKNLIGKKTPKGDVINSDDDFCKYLLASYSVAAVSGSAFGMSPYFRVSYPVLENILLKGCERIKQAVNNLT